MPRVTNHSLSFLSLLLLLCLYAVSPRGAEAAVFRDRAAFEAAAQNLRTLDFESVPSDLSRNNTIDGISFVNPIGFGVGTTSLTGVPGKVLYASGVGEIVYLTIYLPPGTTAVGCEQFSRPMEVSTSTGEKVLMTQSDGSNFVGFISDIPLGWLRVTLDEPEPVPTIYLDNLSYGQKRAGNEPPAPLLLTVQPSGRAAALESVGLTAEPFVLDAPNTRNLGSDGRTRVTLFLVGVKLDSPGDAASVTVRAEDAQHRVFDLPVEAVGGVKNLSWMSQVTVRLPDGLAGAGDVGVTVTVRGAASNRATFRVN